MTHPLSVAQATAWGIRYFASGNSTNTSNESDWGNNAYVSINCTYLEIRNRKITNIIFNDHYEIGEYQIGIIDISQNLIQTLPKFDDNCSQIICNSNRISVIEGLPQNIAKLNISRNRLQGFIPITNYNSLTYLNISHNFIQTMTILPPNLETFICCENRFRQLPTPLPANLKILKCCKNRLQTLPDELPTTLEIISCRQNYLISLPNSLMQCGGLIDIKYEANPNIRISEEILAFIDRIIQENVIRRENARQMAQPRVARVAEGVIDVGDDIYINTTPTSKTVYSDGQNVHNTTIHKNMLANIRNMMCDEQTISSIDECIDEFEKLANDIVPRKNAIQNIWNKLTSSSENTPDIQILRTICSYDAKYSNIDKTFGEIFVYIWNRIRKSPDINEIIKIIVVDLPEIEKVCMTGRLSRLINNMSGFYDDICMAISDNDQIQAKYNVIKKRLSNLNDTSIEYNILFKYRLRELLEEIEISRELIDVWTTPFDDVIKDLMSEGRIDNKKIQKAVGEKYYQMFVAEYKEDKMVISQINSDLNLSMQCN